MSIKKLWIGAVFATMLCIGMTAHAQVTVIKPDQNIGVYASNQAVSFTITRDDSTQSERFTYTLENIDGQAVRSGAVTLAAGSTEGTITVGNFLPGWYRLKVYDPSSTEIGIFASCTVVEPLTGMVTSPISACFTGYTGLSNEQIKDYSDAFGLLGLSSVRDAQGWYNGSSSKPTHDKFMTPLGNNGIKPLLTYNATNVLTDSEKGVAGNLFETASMLSRFAAEYGSKVGAWEIINEPDLKSDQYAFSADMFSSYYKAAALGIEENAPDVSKSYGGLCQSAGDFFELMMQNGVQKYTDSVNVHAHNTSNLNISYRSFSSDLAKKAKIYSAIYGGNQPLWISEAGLSTPVDANQVVPAAHLRSQAKYAITSAVESMGKYGTENYFWFTAKHFLEDDLNWGSTSPEHCTYPAFYSLSMLTRYLGEGKMIGEVITADDQIAGYFFDAGDYDVAVLWNKSDGTRYQQIKASQPVKVNSLISGTEYIYGTNDGIVNLKLTDEPVLVRFSGDADEENYSKKTFTSSFVHNTARTTGEKVVLQAKWDGNFTTQNGRYILSPGETYSITLNIYNFNDEAVSGSIALATDANTQIVGDSVKTYTAPAYSEAAVTTLQYSITLSQYADYMEKGCISFSGDAAGSDLLNVVCGYVVNKEVTRSELGDITEVLSANGLTSAWENGNATTGITRSIVKTSGQAEDTFTATFSGGNRYWYPRLATTVSPESDGLVFNLNGLSLGTGTKMRVYVYTHGGSYVKELGSLESGVKEYVLPWMSFDAASGTAIETLNPADIIGLSIGFKTDADSEVRYRVSGMGTYDISNESATEDFDAQFVGVVEDGVYYEGSDAVLKITGEFDHIYHNYEELQNYSVDNGMALIPLADMETGAHNILVTKTGEFGKIHYKSIDFCIKANDDYVSGESLY